MPVAYLPYDPSGQAAQESPHNESDNGTYQREMKYLDGRCIGAGFPRSEAPGAAHDPTGSHPPVPFPARQANSRVPGRPGGDKDEDKDKLYGPYGQADKEGSPCRPPDRGHESGCSHSVHDDKSGEDNEPVTRGEMVRTAAGLPTGPGVYRFLDERGRVIYIGRATNLRTRVQSYWGELADRRHLRRMIPQIRAIQALSLASVHEAAWLERNLLARSLPRWNRIRFSEVAAWIVLDPNPRHPNLSLTTQDKELEPSSGSSQAVAAARRFGPYLGTTRTRLGLSGILRVWPIHLTGTALSSSERAMAEVRCATPGDREPWADAIVALLSRDPATVLRHRELLIEHRSRAVEALGFETAQQIQEELTGVDWLTQTQRMTGVCPPDLTVTGWADGWAVTLQAHNGSFDQWTVRPMDAEQGQALMSQTPEEWRDIARINAELTAHLAIPESA